MINIQRVIYQLLDALAEEIVVRDGIVYVYMEDGTVWSFTKPQEELV